MSRKPVNVLLTSAGRHRQYIEYFRTAVGAGGKVVAADIDSKALTLRVAHAGAVLPPPSADDYGEQLLRLCKKEEINLVLSLHDIEAPHLARWAGELLKNSSTLALGGDFETASRCLDKFATAQWLLEKGFSSPPTWIDVEDAIQDGSPPYIVRPRFGFGSQGMLIVRETKLLTAALELLCSQREQKNSFGADLQSEFVISECLNGIEYGIDIVNDLAGDYVCTFVKEKIRMGAGGTSVARIIDDQALKDLGKRLGKSLRHKGLFDVDVLVSNGVHHVLDINPRFGGHYPLAHNAGADVPRFLIDSYQGLDASAWLQPRIGTVSETVLDYMSFGPLPAAIGSQE